MKAKTSKEAAKANAAKREVYDVYWPQVQKLGVTKMKVGVCRGRKTGWGLTIDCHFPEGEETPKARKAIKDVLPKKYMYDGMLYAVTVRFVGHELIVANKACDCTCKKK